MSSNLPHNKGITMNQYEYQTEGLLLDDRIKEVVDSAPEVKKRKQMIEQAEPGDILLVRTAPSEVKKKSFVGKAFSKALPVAQRSPFTSSKLVVNNSKLIGYGLSSRPHTPFAYYSFNVFLRRTYMALLMRTDKATKEEKKDVVKWALERKDTIYGGDQLVKSFFNRLLKESILQIPIDEGDNQITAEEAKEWRNPLICSSVLAMAYKAAGVDLDLGRKSLFNVWPREFAISPDFYPVCKIDLE